MKAAADGLGNALLSALALGAPGPWVDQLERVDLALGTVVHESYRPRDHVYFPVTAVISLLYVLADGNTAEVAVVGHEGVVGTSVFMGDGATPSRAVVQCAGTAMRLPAALLKQAFVQRSEVAFLLLQFTQALIAQMSQTAVCNRHHSIDQQLCRWLLLMLDRHEGNEIAMTHELIANMLGVRRESVSMAAARLQKADLITYWRGRITVLDRPALEARACECYAVVKAEYDRMLPALAPPAPASVGPTLRTDAERLRFLHGSGLLDSPPEETYDAITRQLAELLAVPFVMVSLLDAERDWFKSCVGFSASESPAATSFCEVFFAGEEPSIVIEDTRADARFAQHPLVRGMPFIRFYAAVRLVVAGYTVGTLCAYDVKERRLDSVQLQALQAMAAATVVALESAVRDGPLGLPSA